MSLDILNIQRNINVVTLILNIFYADVTSEKVEVEISQEITETQWEGVNNQ